MSQDTPVTQARLAFWVRPEHADEFNAHITHTLVPILKRIGITRIAPNPRREIEGVCSRLLELNTPDEIDRSSANWQPTQIGYPKPKTLLRAMLPSPSGTFSIA